MKEFMSCGETASSLSQNSFLEGMRDLGDDVRVF